MKLPKGFNPRRCSESTLKALGEWQKLGIVRVNGEPYPRAGDKAGLFAPEGTPGRLSSCSTISARSSATTTPSPTRLAVGHLADRLKGYGRFVHPWPTDEKHLSLDQRTELQQLLIAKGFMVGEPDGVIGPATLEAVKTFQRSKGHAGGRIPEPHYAEALASEAPPANVPETTSATPPPEAATAPEASSAPEKVN